MKQVRIPEQWSPDQALALTAFLDRVIEAIWRAHGPEMAQLLAELQPPARLRRPRSLPRRHLRTFGHHDIPF